MSFFLKLVSGFILLLITFVLWYCYFLLLAPLNSDLQFILLLITIAPFTVYRMRKSILSSFLDFCIYIETKRKKSNLIRFNLPEYIAINIFGDCWQSILKFSDLKMYNYLTEFYITQKSMSYIEKSYIPNVIDIHCNLHDRLIANSKITPTVEFTQTYELAQKYFQDCISNYEYYKNKRKQENEYESEKDSYYWHDRWNNSQNSHSSHRSSHRSSHANSQNNSHDNSQSHSNSKKSRKYAEKEAQIREKLNKFRISESDAEIIFGKSWRTKLGKPDREFFYVVQMIAINIQYDFDGRYRRKYGSLYFKVLEIIEIVTGNNNTNDTNDYVNDSTRNDLKSAFDILGLKTTSTMDAIKTRYRELILKHHPDRNHGSQKSSQETIKINNAYELIMEVKNTA